MPALVHFEGVPFFAREIIKESAGAIIAASMNSVSTEGSSGTPGVSSQVGRVLSKHRGLKVPGQEHSVCGPFNIGLWNKQADSVHFEVLGANLILIACSRTYRTFLVDYVSTCKPRIPYRKSCQSIFKYFLKCGNT